MFSVAKVKQQVLDWVNISCLLYLFHLDCEFLTPSLALQNALRPIIVYVAIGVAVLEIFYIAICLVILILRKKLEELEREIFIYEQNKRCSE